jgi:hypothetical protein
MLSKGTVHVRIGVFDSTGKGCSGEVEKDRVESRLH